MFIRPFVNGVYEWLSEDNNDVTVAKGLLGLLGYGRQRAEGPSCFAGKEFFDDVRKFQKDQGLKVDGVIAPDGETAQTIDKLLSEQPPDDTWGTSEHDKQCAHNLLNVDTPVCRGIERARKRGRSRRRGAPAGAACWESANERYAKCLRGTPLDELPPLDTWNN